MQRRTRIAVGGLAVAIALGAGAAGVASASGGDDGEAPSTDDGPSRGKAAALGHIPGGRVTDTEVGDEENLYVVEVTKPYASQADVQLDQVFKVVGSEGGSDTGGDGD